MTLENITKEIEKLRLKLHSLGGEEWKLREELRKFPSNNELRKKCGGNKDRFERLKNERDLQSKEFLEKLEEIKKQEDQCLQEIDSLAKLPAYIDFVWETQTKPEFIKKIDDEMVSYLKKEGFSCDFLLSKAKDFVLAREILICYQSPTYGRGFDGYSMSVNAYEAQENRQKPISKFNKQDVADFNSLFGTKTTLKTLKEFLLSFGEAGEHHTSKFFNMTEHYSIPLAISRVSKQEFVRYFGEIDGFTRN